MIKSYIFRIMDERMYVISEKGEDSAVVVDPFEDGEAFKDLENIEGLKKVFILLTHHHFDHISGVNALKEKFDCEVICTSACGKIICSEENGSRRFPFLFLNQRETFYYIRDNYEFPYTCTADTTFDGEMKLKAAGHEFRLLEMPGHTASSMMIMMDEQFMFTGDNVIGNGQELIFKDACKEEYARKVIPFLEGYKCTGVKIMPGHGEPDSVEHFFELVKDVHNS